MVGTRCHGITSSQKSLNTEGGRLQGLNNAPSKLGTHKSKMPQFLHLMISKVKYPQSDDLCTVVSCNGWACRFILLLLHLFLIWEYEKIKFIICIELGVEVCFWLYMTPQTEVTCTSSAQKTVSHSSALCQSSSQLNTIGWACTITLKKLERESGGNRRLQTAEFLAPRLKT